MAKDAEVPKLKDLQRPEKLDDILAKDNEDDCLPCRVIGSGAFVGLAAYTYFSGRAQLKIQEAKIIASKSVFGMKSRQTGLAGLSLGLLYLGILRWKGI